MGLWLCLSLLYDYNFHNNKGTIDWVGEIPEYRNRHDLPMDLWSWVYISIGEMYVTNIRAQS